MKRATKAQTEARVNDLIRIVLDGAVPAWDLCEFVREMEGKAGSNWQLADGMKPLSYSQIRRYAAMAEKRVAESCRASRKKLLRRHLAQRRHLYAKAVSQGDVRAGLACLDSEAKLLSLFDGDLADQIEKMRKQVAELKAHRIGQPAPPNEPGASGPAPAASAN